MDRVKYYVVKKDGQWKVKYQNDHYGPYATQREAIKAAVDFAHAKGKAGIDSQVLVQNEANQFRTEWTYGHDPYPPRG